MGPVIGRAPGAGRQFIFLLGGGAAALLAFVLWTGHRLGKPPNFGFLLIPFTQGLLWYWRGSLAALVGDGLVLMRYDQPAVIPLADITDLRREGDRLVFLRRDRVRRVAVEAAVAAAVEQRWQALQAGAAPSGTPHAWHFALYSGRVAWVAAAVILTFAALVLASEHTPWWLAAAALTGGGAMRLLRWGVASWVGVLLGPRLYLIDTSPAGPRLVWAGTPGLKGSRLHGEGLPPVTLPGAAVRYIKRYKEEGPV